MCTYIFACSRIMCWWWPFWRMWYWHGVISRGDKTDVDHFYTAVGVLVKEIFVWAGQTAYFWASFTSLILIIGVLCSLGLETGLFFLWWTQLLLVNLGYKNLVLLMDVILKCQHHQTTNPACCALPQNAFLCPYILILFFNTNKSAL